jgi:hypothetical protein
VPFLFVSFRPAPKTPLAARRCPRSRFGGMERWALELIILVLSFGIFGAYHLWLFFIHDRIHPGGLHSAWAMGKKARAVACATWANDEKDVINGIQCVRNGKRKGGRERASGRLTR